MNIRSPTFFTVFIVILALLSTFFIWAYSVAINIAQIISIFGLLGVGIVAVVLLSKKGKRYKDDMDGAIDYAREWWEKRFQQKLTMEQLSAYRRYFPPSKTPFFGFIFYRLGSLRTNKPIAIVVEKLTTSFNIIKAREMANDEDLHNPFCILETVYKGSPVPDIQIEPWMRMLYPSKDEKGVVVNVGREKRALDEEWEGEKEE